MISADQRVDLVGGEDVAARSQSAPAGVEPVTAPAMHPASPDHHREGGDQAPDRTVLPSWAMTLSMMVIGLSVSLLR